jgi:hypothetical protein
MSTLTLQRYDSFLIHQDYKILRSFLNFQKRDAMYKIKIRREFWNERELLFRDFYFRPVL